MILALRLARVSLFDSLSKNPTPRYAKTNLEALKMSHQIRDPIRPQPPYDSLARQSPSHRRKNLELIFLLIYIRNVHEAHYAGIADILLRIFRVGVHDGENGILHLQGGSDFVEDGGGAAIFCFVAGH